MYCVNCGEYLKDSDKVCPSCGTPVAGRDHRQDAGGSDGRFSDGAGSGGPQFNSDGTSHQEYTYSANGSNMSNYPGAYASYDSGSVGWGFLGCCFPLVGLILYLVWKDNKPMSAKKAGIGALVGVGISVLFYVIVIVAGIGFGALGLGASGIFGFDADDFGEFADILAEDIRTMLIR